MTFLEEWADYERHNRRADEAYLRRGCPDCGDIATTLHYGTKCGPCKRRFRSVNL